MAEAKLFVIKASFNTVCDLKPLLCSPWHLQIPQIPNFLLESK